MKAIVIYTSKYGSAEKYAQWIAKALECPAKTQQDVSAEELSAYDAIIYGGGLYAGKVAGLKKFISKLDSAQEKKLILYMVGATNPAQTTVYEEYTQRNLPEQWRGRFEVFALHGNMLFSKMSGIHKIMMRVPKSMAEKKPEAERTAVDKYFIESFGSDVSFTSREQIEPILEYLLQKQAT